MRGEVQAGFKNGGSEDEVLKKFSDVDFLLIDDIGSDLNSEWQIRMLFSIVDKRWMMNLPTMFTSNLTEKEIKEKLEHRLHSRFFASKNHIITDWDNDYRLVENEGCNR